MSNINAWKKIYFVFGFCGLWILVGGFSTFRFWVSTLKIDSYELSMFALTYRVNDV
jgi:hypothetical protein